MATVDTTGAGGASGTSSSGSVADTGGSARTSNSSSSTGGSAIVANSRRPAYAALAIRPLVVVTGASSGIGWHLARQCAAQGFDLVLAADEPLAAAQAECEAQGARVLAAVQTDLATRTGVEALVAAIGARPVYAVLANAGRSLGHAFLQQRFVEARQVLDTNVVGTLHLLHRLVPGMRARGVGRILVTASIVAFQPGPFQAVYNASKAFLHSFCFAFRNELQGSGVSMTCLMPGATDTAVFARAGMQDTRIGAADWAKMDPAEVARAGIAALLAGRADVVPGLVNRAIVAVSKVAPQPVLAELHRVMAEPGKA